MANDLAGDAVETLEPPPAPPPVVPPASPDAPNPYDEMFQAQDVGRQQRLRTAVVQAADTTPDRAADVQKLSTQTGISADIVDRNYDAIKKRALLTTVPYAQIQRDSPATAAFLSEPEHAAVAHDDMENLGFLEWIATAPQRAIIQANAEQDYAALRTKAIFGTITAAERAQMDTARVAAEQGGKLGAGDSWFRGAITGGAKMLQFLSSAAPAALVGTVGGGIVGGAVGLPGGPPGVVAGAIEGGTLGFEAGSAVGLARTAFESSAGPAYDRYLAMTDTTGRPMDVDVARAAAITEGAINGALMGKIPGSQKLLALLHAIPGADKLTGVAVGSAITEALKQPTIRAALGTMIKSYAGNLTHGTALMVAQDAVSIIGGELAKTVASSTAPATAPDYGYGNRYGTSTPKGLGFFGPLVRPDGQVMSEFSIGVDLGGQETEIPSLVPTLTKDEVSQLLALRDGDAMPPAIRVKAEAFARQRIAAGHDPFAAAGEQQTTYPELARAAIPSVKPAAGQFDHISAADAAAQLWQATTNAVQSLAIISGVGPAMTFAHEANRAIRAQQGPAFFTALGEGVAQSKTAQRLPQAAQDFLAQATKGGPVETVYAPLETWDAHWQAQGVDPAAMAATVTGSVEAYARAQETGTDLPIPTARYATTLAATEHNGFFANELKLSPEAMNARESAEWLAEQKAKAAENIPVIRPPLSAVERVHQDLLDQQARAGTPADVGEQHAALVSAGFGSLAERAGLDPADIYRGYGITVERPEGTATPEAPAPVQQTTGASTEEQLADLIARKTDSQPERRQTPGEAPGGVERRVARDEQINAMADIPAAAARMLAENPDLVRDAEAMKAQADTVGRIQPPAGRPESPLGAAIVDAVNHSLDTTAAGGETEGPHAPDLEEGRATDQTRRADTAGVSESRPRERESPTQRTQRTTEHYAAVFADLTDAARAVDPAVDPVDLKAEFDFRLEALQALDEGATDPKELLRDIARLGGINTEDSTFPGEIRWLKDGMKFGRVAGINVLTRSGVSLDDMVTQLRQDQKYQWVETVSDLLEAIDDVQRHPGPIADVLPGTDELARLVKIDPNVAWWKDSWRPRPAVDEGTIAEDAGDASFNIDEFDQSAKDAPQGDLLDTGEVQPRLPGDVGAVQDQNVPTPELEAPFSLTSEVAKSKGFQGTLFQSPAPTFFSALTRAGEALPQEKGTPEQMAAMLTKAKGIKKEELEWSGVVPWLKAQTGSVTKQAIVDYLRANELQVTETMLGGENPAVEAVDVDLRRIGGDSPNAYWESFDRRTGRMISRHPGSMTETQARNDATWLNVEQPAPTKFEQYTLPGGRNYRELLLTLPPRPSSMLEPLVFPSYADWLKDEIGADYHGPEHEVQNRKIYEADKARANTPTGRIEWARRQLNLAVQAEEAIRTAARKPIFDEYRPLINDAEDRFGDRFLDREQRIKARNERDRLERERDVKATHAAMDAIVNHPSATERADRAQEALRQVEETTKEQEFTAGHFKEKNVVAHIRMDDRVDANGKKVLFVEEVQSDWHQRGRREGYSLPEPPLPELTFHEREHDWIARDAQGREWGTVGKGTVDGRADAELYLRRYITRREAEARLERRRGVPDAPFKTTWPELAMKRAVRYAAEHGYDRIAWTTGEQQNARYDLSKHVGAIEYNPDSQRLAAYNHVGEPVFSQRVHEDDLADYIGKDAAEKLLLTPRESPRLGDAQIHTLSGVDLTVGGSGMKGFYDKILPSFMNKFGKPFEARVGETEIKTDNAPPDVVARYADQPDHPFTKRQTATVHALDITPQIRDSVLAGQPLFQEGRRASITIGPDRKVTINLFAHADLSSFVHESGHLFLEVLGDLTDKLKTLDPATLTPEQGRLLQDHQTILSALGVENRSAIGREQHEQVANWFESYLMEGKAPSVELQSAFSRFRAWMLDVYRALRTLKAPLTDEVRGVFDRLLASDQAIADAEARRGQRAMFLTAKEAGMTPERFALYRDAVETAHATAQQQLDQQLLADVRREQTARWKAQQAETRATVQREIQQQPVYRALAAIRDGTHPNGDPLIEGHAPEPMPLSRAILVDRYGEAAVALFPAAILTRDGGADPNALAEGFGFSSGDALLHAIDRAPAIDDAIDRETQQRMLREHGSLLLDGTLPEKADVAVANDQRDQIVRAEIAALWAREQDVSPFVVAGKQALADEQRERAYERRWFEAEAKLRIAIAEGRKQVEIDALTKEVAQLKRQARGGAARIRAGIPSAAAMHEAARARIEATTVRALKPQEFWSASRRAAQQAIDRAARQDFTGAITAKTQELLTLHLFREAERAKADVETRVAAAGRLDRPGTRKTLGLAGGGFLDQIDGILDRFGFSAADQSVLDRKASIEAWQTAKRADGVPVDLPASVLNGEFRKPFAELTVSQFRDITDALTQLAHLARAQGRTFKNAAADAFRVERDGLVASIRAKNVEHKLPLEFGRTESRRLSIGDYIASLTKVSILARALDGSADGGPMWESFIRRFNEASDAEQVRNLETGQRMADILEQHYPGRERMALSQRTEVPGIGSVSKELRLAVALNWGTETGQDRLLSDPVKKWTREQVETILGTLDRRDWSFVRHTWDLIGSFWPEIAAKQERVVGVAPEKVAGVTVHTKFGDLAGAYYPLKYDGRLASRAVQLELAGLAHMQQAAAYVQSTTERGFVQTRLEHVELPVRLELGVAFQHLGQVIHDLTHHEMLIDVTRLLRDKQISQAIYDTKGSNIYRQFTSAVQDIATGLAPATDTLQRSANFLRSGMQIASLGFNLNVGFKHPFGLFNGAALIGPEWMAKGIARWVGDAAHMSNTLTWIESQSPMMRERGRTSTVELHDLAGEMRSAGGWFDSLVRTVSADHLTQQTITNGYLWHIGLLQKVADIPTWLGGYEKAMDAQRRAGGEVDETRAARLADQAVLDSQGGGTVKDLAKFQRGGPYARLFMTFYSYGARVFNSTVEAAGKTEFRSPASVIKFLGNLSLIYLLPAMANAAMRQASGRLKSGEDAATAFVVETGKDMLGAALNGLVGLRELSGPLLYGRDYTGPAGTQFFQVMTSAVKQIRQEELDEPLEKSLNDVLGVLLHYPASQVDRTVAGWEALRDGRTENPLALVSGGPPKK